MNRNYHDIALKTGKINEYLYYFCNENNDINIFSNEITHDKRTIKFGYIGADVALVIIFFKKNGLATIQFKTGKNQNLGKKLADYLYETLNTK